MPIHDWTRVDAGIFHSFHLKWIAELDKALNGGILPKGYYSLAEQHAGESIPDLLTLHASSEKPRKRASGGRATAVLDIAPKVARKMTVGEFKSGRRRTLAVRHVSEHRLVAIIEIVSPANKDRWQSVAEFASKIEMALQFEVNALVLDLFPPGSNDICGMHGAIWRRLERTEVPYDVPTDQSLTLASYAVARTVDLSRASHGRRNIRGHAVVLATESFRQRSPGSDLSRGLPQHARNLSGHLATKVRPLVELTAF